MDQTPSQEVDQTEAAQCAKYRKALGAPIRLQMIRALQSGPKSVSDISLLLDLELPNVCHHLRVLAASRYWIAVDHGADCDRSL